MSRDAVADLFPRGDANLWFHFDSPTEEELRFLQEDLKIHHLTLEDVVNQHQRPKVESFEDYVYIAIHPLMHRKKWQIEPSELDLLLGRHYQMNQLEEDYRDQRITRRDYEMRRDR